MKKKIEKPNNILIYYTTEMLVYCKCKGNPHYVCWGGKITEKSFRCEKCKTWNALTGARHYIKNPKPMISKEWEAWIKGAGKKFLKKRDGLLMQKKHTTRHIQQKLRMIGKRKKLIKHEQK